MGVAALVLGIISIIIGFIPLCGSIAYFPAIVGLILGIVDIVMKSKNNGSKGMGIAGTVLSGIALVVITFWLFIFGAIFTDATIQNEINNQILNEMKNSDWNF